MSSLPDMKIYFYTSLPTENPDVVSALSYLKKTGVDLVGNVISESSEAVEDVDGLIIFGRSFDTRSGYLAALSLAQRKDVLILLASGAVLDESLAALQKDKSFAKKLRIFYYKKDLVDRLKDFILSLDTSTLREMTNIKYTLRLSPKISDYLNWKGERIDMPKADWLRDKIKEVMEGDTEYKKYLDDKFRIEK